MSRLWMGIAVLAAVVLQACALLPGRDSSGPGPLDLNCASTRKIEELPGITPSMAARIVAGRPYGDPRALVERGILTPRELDRIAELVIVREQDRRP